MKALIYQAIFTKTLGQRRALPLYFLRFAFGYKLIKTMKHKRVITQKCREFATLPDNRGVIKSHSFVERPLSMCLFERSSQSKQY